MRPHGIVYQAQRESSKTSGELTVALTEKQKKHFKFLSFLGSNFSSLALAFVVFFYGPQFEKDLNYQAGLAKAEVHEAEKSFAELPYGNVNQEEVAQKTDEFAISIPAIGASAGVIGNVDPYNEEQYKAALRQGIAHAQGTGLPGGGGRIYLFAHSTSSPAYFSEYNAVFYQLRLLSDGDLIFINFNGTAHLYKVTEKVVVNASDTHWLTGTGSEEELVLQTCDPPGTTLKRLLVIAKPVD